MTVDIANKIIAAPNGYTQETVKLAKEYLALYAAYEQQKELWSKLDFVTFSFNGRKQMEELRRQAFNC